MLFKILSWQAKYIFTRSQYVYTCNNSESECLRRLLRDIDSPKKGSCWWGRRLCKGWYIRGIKYTNTNLHTWTNPSPQASRSVHAVSAPYQYTADAAAGSGTGFQGNGSSSRSPQSVSSRFSAESVTPFRSLLS